MQILRLKEDRDNILGPLHIRFFPGFFLSTLGEGFLKNYYRVALRNTLTVCFVAKNDEDEIVGFVIGTTCAKKYSTKLLLSAPFSFLWEGIKLVLSRPKALLRLCCNLDKKAQKEDIVDNQDYAEINLIGVEPTCKGKGIGHQLLKAFEKELRVRGVQSLSLTTDFLKNEQTLIAYKSWGFKVLYNFVTYPDRKMCRLIKEIEL